MKKSFFTITLAGCSLLSSLSFADGRAQQQGQTQFPSQSQSQQSQCQSHTGNIDQPTICAGMLPLHDMIYHSKRARHAAERVARKAFDLSRRGHHHHDAYRRLSPENFQELRAHAIALELAATNLAAALHHDVSRAFILELLNNVTVEYNAVAAIDSDDANRIQSAYIRLVKRIDVLK